MSQALSPQRWRHSTLDISLYVAALLLLASRVAASWDARPLGDFAAETVTDDAHSRALQRFRHHEAYRDNDGSEVTLRWEVDADPAALLSIDAVVPRGVRVIRCAPRSLLLEMPDGEARGSKAWRHVAASSHLHGCTGLARGKHLYRRVLAAQHVSPVKQDMRQVALTTEELQSPAQIFPRIDFSYQYLPGKLLEAHEVEIDDDMSNSRRLDFTMSVSPPVIRNEKLDLTSGHTTVDFGGGASKLPNPKHHTIDEAVDTSTSFGNANTINDFQPSAHLNDGLLDLDNAPSFSRIAWNWDYSANCTRNPEFEFEFPGGEGWLRLYKPYVKAFFAFTVNFTSTLRGVSSPPEVHIVANMDGVADVNLDVATSLNFTEDARMEPLSKRDFPFIGKERLLLKPLKFFIGGVPMQINPEFSCHLNAYHFGQLQGSLRVGLATLLKINGLMTFDTNSGLQTNVTAKAMNVKFTPPTWMVFTKHFELGVMVEPELWLKGDVGVFQDLKMGMALSPYMNLSVMQKGQEALGGPKRLSTQGLVVYPYRVVGLPAGSSYSVRVGVNGIHRNTSSHLSIDGAIEFHDKVKQFSFGSISETLLLENAIEVQLISDGQMPPVATSIVQCGSLIMGECAGGGTPPLKAKLQLYGKDVTVFLATAWMMDPEAHIRERMKCVELRVPKLTLSNQMLQSLNGRYMELQIRRDGHVYNFPLAQAGEPALSSEVVWDMGLRYLDAWKDTSSNNGPQVELRADDALIASGRFPPVQWMPGQSMLDAMQQVDFMTNALNGNNGEYGLNSQHQQAKVTLSDPQKPGETVAFGSIALSASDAAQSSYWILPFQADTFRVGEVHTLYWTVHVTNAALSSLSGGAAKMTFQLDALVINSHQTSTKSQWSVAFAAGCTEDVQSEPYTDTSAFCIFSYDLKTPADLVGQTALLKLSWQVGTKDGTGELHSLTSPAITFVGTRRALFELAGLVGGKVMAKQGTDEERQGGLDLPPRQLANFFSWSRKNGSAGASGLSWGTNGASSADDFSEHMASNSHKCNAIPLVYAVEFGCLQKEDMKNMMLPLQTLSNAGQSVEPGVSYIKPIMAETSNESFEDLFPKSVCAGGFCSGELPGCRPEAIQPISVKEMVFKLSRKFKISEMMQPSMRDAMAYALSVVPDAIEASGEETDGNISPMTPPAGWFTSTAAAVATLTTSTTQLPMHITAAAPSTSTTSVQSQTLMFQTQTPTLAPTTQSSKSMTKTQIPTLRPSQSPTSIPTPQATPSPWGAVPTPFDKAASTTIATPTSASPSGWAPSTPQTATPVPTQGSPPTPPETAAPTLGPPQTATPTPAPPTVQTTSPTPSQRSSSKFETEAQTPAQTPTPPTSPQTSGPPTSSPTSNRRLDANAEGKVVEFDTVVVRAVKPLLYQLDELHLQRLIDAGAFGLLSDGREATHGPISIVAVSLREGHGHGKNANHAVNYVMDIDPRHPGVATVLPITFAVVAVAAAPLAFCGVKAARMGARADGYSPVANPASDCDVA